MKLEKGQNIKILFKNGTQAEGIVDSFENELIINSFDSKSSLIILHPMDDILAIKIMREYQDQSLEKIIEQKTEIDKQFEEIYNEPSDDDLRIKKLAELRSLMLEQEKKIVSNKLKDHSLPEVKNIEYGYPGFFKKQSPK